MEVKVGVTELNFGRQETAGDQQLFHELKIYIDQVSFSNLKIKKSRSDVKI